MGSEKPINSGGEIKIIEDFKNYECTPVPAVHLLSIICVVYTPLIQCGFCGVIIHDNEQRSFHRTCVQCW